MCADELLWSMEGKRVVGEKETEHDACGGMEITTPRDKWEEQNCRKLKGEWRERCKLNVSSRSNQISCWEKKNSEDLEKLEPKV